MAVDINSYNFIPKMCSKSVNVNIIRVYMLSKIVSHNMFNKVATITVLTLYKSFCIFASKPP